MLVIFGKALRGVAPLLKPANRSTMLGAYIARLHKALGYRVHRLNYLGDWGKQFGLVGVGFDMYGDEAKLKADPLEHLLEVYVAANRAGEADSTIHDAARQYFADLEEGNVDKMGQWHRFRELSIDAYQRMYKRLGVSFDEFSGESDYGPKSKDVAQRLAELGLTERLENGALLFKDDKISGTILVKGDGTSTYLLRDVAAAISRQQTDDLNSKPQFDKMLYVVSKQQSHHFRQLFFLLKQMGWSNTSPY